MLSLNVYRKIGIVLLLVGIALPTATLPYITEFHPVPNVCLTSNFFNNLGNMVIPLSAETAYASGNRFDSIADVRSGLPYRYVFSTGVVLFLTGIGFLTLPSRSRNRNLPC